MASLEQMRTLMGSTKNFIEYRETLHRANPPCIPFFGQSSIDACRTLELTLVRRISDGPCFHRRWNSFHNQEDEPDQLCEASKNGRGDSRYSAISERAIPAAARCRATGLHPQEYAVCWRRSRNVRAQSASRAEGTRRREDCTVRNIRYTTSSTEC